MSKKTKTLPWRIGEGDPAALERTAAADTESWARGDWFQTFTGISFYPKDPEPESFHILDVAHALSMQCRYNGHTARFISVAEHCVLLAQYVLSEGGSFEDAYEALMHDGVEAYTSDVPKPWKNSVPGLKEAEDEIEAHFRRAFGMYEEKPEWMSLLDKRVVLDEKAALMKNRAWKAYDGREPLGVAIKCWPPEHAKIRFLATHEAIVKRMEGTYVDDTEEA